MDASKLLLLLIGLAVAAPAALAQGTSPFNPQKASATQRLFLSVVYGVLKTTRDSFLSAVGTFAQGNSPFNPHEASATQLLFVYL